MVEAFFDLLHASLVKGHDVKLSGFGNFNIRRKAPPQPQSAHRGIHPHRCPQRCDFSRQPKVEGSCAR